MTFISFFILVSFHFNTTWSIQSTHGCRLRWFKWQTKINIDYAITIYCHTSLSIFVKLIFFRSWYWFVALICSASIINKLVFIDYLFYSLVLIEHFFFQYILLFGLASSKHTAHINIYMCNHRNGWISHLYFDFVVRTYILWFSVHSLELNAFCRAFHFNHNIRFSMKLYTFSHTHRHFGLMNQQQKHTKINKKYNRVWFKSIRIHTTDNIYSSLLAAYLTI